MPAVRPPPRTAPTLGRSARPSSPFCTRGTLPLPARTLRVVSAPNRTHLTTLRSPLPPTPPHHSALAHRPAYFPSPPGGLPQRPCGACAEHRFFPPPGSPSATTILAAGGARARRKRCSRPRCSPGSAVRAGGEAVDAGTSAEGWDAIHSDLDSLKR